MNKMNQNRQLWKDNIDEVMEKVNLRLRFFAMWSEDQLLSKAVLFKELHPSSKERVGEVVQFAPDLPE